MNIIPNLEREGGHIVVLLVIIVIFAHLHRVVPEDTIYTEILSGAVGALGYAMKGKPTNPPVNPA